MPVEMDGNGRVRIPRVIQKLSPDFTIICETIIFITFHGILGIRDPGSDHRHFMSLADQVTGKLVRARATFGSRRGVVQVDVENFHGLVRRLK